MERDRQDGAQSCPARQSQQKWIRERIADQRLEGRAGNAQRPADEKGEQRARGAQIPHDIGAQQLVERHGGGPEHHARTARHSCLLANPGMTPESDSTAIHCGSRAAIVSSETCADGAAMSLKTLRAPASAAS